ncbi:MAG TPA: DUF4082 domain-containing protein [Chitinophaga sp.]|uniref:DUF4082 domain-containing protein n=1 Tax=Chitinophaga sp. TaxID=1869181 RepID=UPI002DBB50C5|nr:DUF4082 domain-containing protein [Chitinophaga sp.]HEU4552835.1 DUF4082 domain-containing protein [Chitinophaga sp.]
MLRTSLSYDYGKQAGLSLSLLVICSLFSARQSVAANHSKDNLAVDTSIFQASDAPATPIVDDGMPIEVGVKFRSVQAGQVNGIRFYKSKAGNSKYQVHLWSHTGQKLAEAAFKGDSSAVGWTEVLFEKPVAVAANTTYIAAYFSGGGDYSSTNPYFTKGVVNGPIHALASGEDGPNGVYKYADKPAFPGDNFGTNNYWVDVVFIPDANSPVITTDAGSHRTSAADTTGPAINALKAVSNPDGTVTIHWTTNENADAAVHYNISAENLSLQTADARAIKEHAVRVSGLVPGVTYYYRVSSKDKAGNITTKPSAVAPPLKFMLAEAPCAIDNSQQGFNLGNPDIGTAVTASGAVTLQPAVSEEFLSLVKTIPDGWTGARYNSDGTASNNNGVITASGIHIFSDHTYEPGATMEFAATYTAGAYQNIGWSIDQPYVDGPWITIGQGSGDGNLYARASNNVSVNLGSNLLDSMHRYKIKWNPASFEFFIDDNPKPAATINMTLTSKMYVQISDYASTDGALSIDWMHIAPYAAEGSFTSRVFDAGDATDWGAVTWHADTPPGTSISISVSSGTTPNPNDGSWLTFKPITAPGEAAGISGRYIQYKATLKTTDTKITPVLKEVAINCKGNSRMTQQAKEALKPAAPLKPAATELSIKVMPNPSSDYFELVSTTPNNDKLLLVNVLDTYGRIVESHRTVAPNSSFQFGQSLSPGNYFLEVVQDSQRKTIKLIKIK